MADITVRFLGEDYTFPQELKEYVVYCNEFEKINDKLQKELVRIMKKKLYEDGGPFGVMHDIEGDLKEKMIKEGKNVIRLLAKERIFDVTDSELIDNNKGYIHYEDTYKAMIDGGKQILMNEVRSWVNGFEKAQNDSLITHVILGAYETSTIKKQCAQADRDYEMAIVSLNKRTDSEEEKRYAELFGKMVYPEIASSFIMYTNELMEFYLRKLEEHSVYDYAKVKPYDINRSSELLNNMSLVDDKKAVLIQAFKDCPYNPDIYANVIELGLSDIDTFKTAQEFYQDSLLQGVLDEYIKNNLKTYEKVKEPVSILAYYRDENAIDILRSLYSSELDVIQNKYREFVSVIENSKALDKWIRGNIQSNMDSIIKKSMDDVKDAVDNSLTKIVSEEQFANYVEIGLITAKDIRLKNSTEIELSKINMEIGEWLTALVLEYIQEAKNRKAKYEKAFDKFDSEVKKQNSKIAEKYNELNHLGILAFSKKKELKAVIAEMESKLSKFKMDNEPKDLKREFERMYG
ncbi:MAG: hypothetical protein QM683_12955 [Lacrimispora sp.]